MKIIEKRLPLHHFLVKKVFGDLSSYRGSEAYCHTVYFDEHDPKIITANLVYVEDEDSVPSGFSNLIEEDLTFDECLIMSTLYFSQSAKMIKRVIYGSVLKTEDDLSHILKPTNGFLLFSFQFDQLAMLVLDVSLDEAVRIRQVYNKQPSLINFNENDDRKLKLFKKTVQEHAIARVVYKPNYQGAKNLYICAQTVS